MSASCDICERPVDGTAYICRPCVDAAGRHLAAVVDAVPAARDVVHGLVRRGPAVARTGGDRIPVNLTAGARLAAVQNALTTWARAVLEERGGELPDGDPIAAAAGYLAGELEWLRHQRYAVEALRDIAAAHRVILAVVDPPAGRRYLGPCRAAVGADECGADLYARDGARHAACRECGTRHEVAERRAWLDQEARRWSYTAAEIAEAYGIRANTIRVWANRGRISQVGTVDGRPTYELGQVLDLAAQDAARRESARIKRETRHAVTSPA